MGLEPRNTLDDFASYTGVALFPWALEHWPEHKHGIVSVPRKSAICLNCKMLKVNVWNTQEFMKILYMYFSAHLSLCRDDQSFILGQCSPEDGTHCGSRGRHEIQVLPITMTHIWTEQTFLGLGVYPCSTPVSVRFKQKLLGERHLLHFHVSY